MMPDREKVIRGLECCGRWTETGTWDEVLCSGCPYVDIRLGCGHRLTADALVLLREQKPVEPKKIELAPDGTYSIYKCGACGAWLRIGDNYCGRCGKEVKRDAND